jgi:hypothetical protein
MSFYNYIKNKNLYKKLNQIGGTVCGCGCETSNSLFLSQASVHAGSKYCECKGHVHGFYFFEGELTGVLNEPALIEIMADFFNYKIMNTDLLREMGIEPLFKLQQENMVLPKWYAPNEQIQVPYFLPSESYANILTICIPIHTVNPDEIVLVNEQYDDDTDVRYEECNICRGKVNVDLDRYGEFKGFVSRCECGLPDKMVVFKVNIDDLFNQDIGYYSYENFYDIIKNICDRIKSEISRNIPDIMDQQKISSFIYGRYLIRLR